MKVLVSLSIIVTIIISVLFISLSAENNPWYKSIGQSLMDLTSSTSPIATTLNTLIAQKNPFISFDKLLNQTKQMIPNLVTFGNFTLLQAALVCAVGAIAAGAATFAAEAYYFKITNDEQQQQQYGNYHSQYLSQLPSIVYGNNQNQFRRNYYEDMDPNNGRVNNLRLKSYPNPNPTRKLSSYLELEKRYPSKSLKRTQRRNQRKNQNTGQQLKNMFPSM